MLDSAVSRLVIENVGKGDGVDVVENKGDVFVMVGVFVLDGEEPDVFGSASVKGSGVALVGEIDFVVVVSVGFSHDGCLVVGEKELVLRTVSVWDDKDDFGDYMIC